MTMGRIINSRTFNMVVNLGFAALGFVGAILIERAFVLAMM